MTGGLVGTVVMALALLPRSTRELARLEVPDAGRAVDPRLPVGAA